MALSDGYGVVIGTLASFTREDPDSYGNYYHGILKVDTPAGEYTCAIDVDTPNTSVGVEYKIISIASSDFSSISTLSNAFHFLESNHSSGAIDYVRSSYLLPRIPPRIARFIRYFFMGKGDVVYLSV